MRKSSGMVLAAALVLPAAAAAQGVGVEVAGIYATLSGDDFTGVNAGIGADGQVRFAMGGRLSLGLGGQYTSHGNDLNSDKFKVLGIFSEPRLTFAMPGAPLTPFIGARIGYMHSSISSGGTDISSNGWYAGGTGGITYNMAPTVKLMAAVIFATIHLGDQTVNGTSQPGSDVSGTSLALRAGVQIGLGR